MTMENWVYGPIFSKFGHQEVLFAQQQQQGDLLSNWFNNHYMYGTADCFYRSVLTWLTLYFSDLLISIMCCSSFNSKISFAWVFLNISLQISNSVFLFFLLMFQGLIFPMLLHNQYIHVSKLFSKIFSELFQYLWNFFVYGCCAKPHKVV